MKKIVFVTIPMKKPDAVDYSLGGNTTCFYTTPVMYPINAILADKLKPNDEVKVVLLKTKTVDQEKNYQSATNVADFIGELGTINTSIGATLSYEELESDFSETKENFQHRMRSMLNKVEPDCELFADITYGPKPLPMILMCTFNFAEKFFNADIRNIVYGKVEFVQEADGKETVRHPELYDVVSLYYLNNLTNTMEAPDTGAALQMLDSFFAL